LFSSVKSGVYHYRKVWCRPGDCSTVSRLPSRHGPYSSTSRAFKQFVGFVEHLQQPRGVRICSSTSSKQGAHLFRHGHSFVSKPELTYHRDRRTAQKCTRSAWHRIAHSQRLIFKRPQIEGAIQRLRPKLVTVSAVLASLIPISLGHWYRFRRDEAEERALRRGTLRPETG
jgi:hypothetical protein